MLEVVEILSNSRNNFLRSIEICKDYLKGWEGIHKICDLLEFNDRVSSKLSQTKDAKKYLDENKKLKVLSEEKIKTLKK